MPHPADQPRELRKALIALLIVQVLFGVWPIVGVLVMQHIPARALVGLRILLAGPCLIALGRPWQVRLAPRDIVACAALAVVGIAANQVLFIEGLARSTPLNGSVLGALVPACTVGLSVLLGRERASRRRLLGLAVALAGALFLVGAEQFDMGPQRLHGNLLLVSNTLVYSVYLVLARPLLARHGARVITGWMFAFAMLWIVPWSWPALTAVPWSHLPARVWAEVAWIVATASVLAYLLNAWALRHVSASTVASFVYLQPLITGIAAGGVLHLRPGWQVFVATAVIFAGVALVSHHGPESAHDGDPPAPFVPRGDEA